MNNNQKYVILSLELHLFFARIMKEHSLFLEAGFTPEGAKFARQAEHFKQQFEMLLSRAVRLSDCIISPEVINSGEIITEFTLTAEKQTQRFTGIQIDKRITQMESKLRSGHNPCVNLELVREVKQLNQTSIRLLNGLIQLKENLIHNVLNCRLFTVNYPLLLKHILREAKLYRTYVTNYENGRDFDCQNMRQIEQFWNQIMMEHALFIRGLLDPSENALIETSDGFAKDYERLLAQSRERSDLALISTTGESLEETLKFRDFKQAGTEGIQDCKIQSIILPLLADHVLREANHYIRLLSN
ncbi:hypothetical protein CLOSTMETH_03021 [[Clostridium] methylpentosum DSM 5476]|jgi:hypothetical protein|uniref:DUF2935 domain-containing protein n=1 Tax=[Clostridium] methylpentosum DSM 5476 TaxID=537013 RepID=C0EGM8_9FIRM|nr:hypothetical protein CLOSTMETH_03021 [[Clostridium] methylpentosum DSM 5476]MEE1491202.1 DUF2935 domain-containing protein [Massilioclostridium sp.]